MTEIDRLCDSLAASGIAPRRMLRDEPMARHTTFRVGGPADVLISARSADEVALVLATAEACDVPAMIIGNGSNLLVRDGGIEGVVVRIGEEMAGIEFDGAHVRAGAGCLMSRLGAECARRGLTGFEPLSGIPGTLGGAAAMNAGAYGAELKDVLRSATVLRGRQIEQLSLEDMAMGYRTSRVLREGLIVTEVCLELTPDDPQAVRARTDDYTARRRAKQPLSMPSAGSTFKRPEGHFAGALIEQCGLKGTRVGGAQVSWMHAGFIVNTGGARAQDVLDLIDLVRTKVRMCTGVELEPEVRVIGRERRG